MGWRLETWDFWLGFEREDSRLYGIIFSCFVLSDRVLSLIFFILLFPALLCFALLCSALLCPPLLFWLVSCFCFCFWFNCCLWWLWFQSNPITSHHITSHIPHPRENIENPPTLPLRSHIPSSKQHKTPPRHPSTNPSHPYSLYFPPPNSPGTNPSWPTTLAPWDFLASFPCLLHSHSLRIWKMRRGDCVGDRSGWNLDGGG